MLFQAGVWAMGVIKESPCLTTVSHQGLACLKAGSSLTLTTGEGRPWASTKALFPSPVVRKRKKS